MSSFDSSMLEAARDGDPVALFNCVVGSRVKLTLPGEIVLDGFIHAADSLSGCIMLRNRIDATSPQQHSIRIIRMSQVKNMEILDAVEKDTEFTIPQYSAEEAKRVELRSSQIAAQAICSIGVGVTPEAQALFDALNKTMPCQWNGQSIQVMDEVTIKPPYTVGDCISNNIQVLSRVRKVLQGEKQKLGWTTI